MRGRRLPDGTPPKRPGEYAYMPYNPRSNWPDVFLGPGEWHICDPTGGVGAVGRITFDRPAAHTVTIHEDGSITCSPSLVMPGGWHGFLRSGEFSSTLDSNNSIR